MEPLLLRCREQSFILELMLISYRYTNRNLTRTLLNMKKQQLKSIFNGY